MTGLELSSCGWMSDTYIYKSQNIKVKSGNNIPIARIRITLNHKWIDRHTEYSTMGPNYNEKEFNFITD